MGRIAFEVSINGEHLYTVGAEQWKFISAQLIGHHIDPDEIRAAIGEDPSNLPKEPSDHMQLHCSVSVSGEDTQVTGPDGNLYPKSKSGSYPARTLVSGDSVQIKIIETDSPDSPDWHSDDPRFGGRVALLPKSRSR